MLLNRLLFCFVAAVLVFLSRPVDAAGVSARPLIVIYWSSGEGIWNPWPLELVLYDTGEAFAGNSDSASLRRLQLDPERLAYLMKNLSDTLREVPEDAGSNPYIFDASTLHLLIWDEEGQAYVERSSYGYACDASPTRCAITQMPEVDWRFNYWVHELPRMVRDEGKPWRPAFLHVELNQTTETLPLNALPLGTIFEDAPVAMLLPNEKVGQRRIACVPTGDVVDVDAVVSSAFVFQVLPRDGGNGQFGVAADRPGTWYIWNWHYATPYPTALPGVYPLYAGCGSR